ncbi:MAG: tetratricopeptide repeat protein [Desulfobacterales bacterium]|jgi:adenylate cyclase|nr:tetratricopeptide repeat protein [Desulfobacterales bacterium]
MAEEGFKRKLTAILSADVEGYSRLMDDDEAATVRTLTAYRSAITDLVQQFSGRVVDSPGDNILAEFTSVVDAVSCAVEIQRVLAERNADLPDERKMQFRIGVNLGDVIDEEERIYGDGVNIAARIESLSEAGGICVSHSAYDQIKNKLKFGYEYLGEHEVKNIREPVKAYRVLMAPEFEGKFIGFDKKASKRGWIWAITAAGIIAVVVLGIWQFYLRRPAVEPASVDEMAYPLPEKPSIAVLPFDNMSKDPEQEYFSDGITEHIITSLSRSPYLFVIARNSTFSYKGKPVKINQIAEELGVRYVLEGSVQRTGDKVRITVQLIDATTGHHVWAENYDREVRDIFDLQDEIAMKIMAELQVELSAALLGKLSSIKTKSIKAYEKYLKGVDHSLRRTVEDVLEARKLAHEAIALDPEYGAAYLLLAQTHLDDVWFYRSKDRAKSLQTAEQLAHKGIDLSGQDALTHRLLSQVFLLRRQYEKAIMEIERAIELEPNSGACLFTYGMILRLAGRFDEAIPVLEKAIRLNPITPINYLNNLAFAYAASEQYEKAVSLWNKAIERNPDYLFAYMGLTAVYQFLGDESKAREAAAEVLRIKPNFSVLRVEKSSPIKDPAGKKRWIDALRKSGLPD